MCVHVYGPCTSYHNLTLMITILYGSIWVFFSLQIFIFWFLNSWQIWWHCGWSTLSLLCLGMVLLSEASLPPFSLTWGKGSLSLISQSFFFLPFLLSSPHWTLGLFIPQVPYRLSLSSYPLFSLTQSQHRHLYSITLHMNK